MTLGQLPAVPAHLAVLPVVIFVCKQRNLRHSRIPCRCRAATEPVAVLDIVWCSVVHMLGQKCYQIRCRCPRSRKATPMLGQLSAMHFGMTLWIREHRALRQTGHRMPRSKGAGKPSNSLAYDGAHFWEHPLAMSKTGKWSASASARAECKLTLLLEKAR